MIEKKKIGKLRDDQSWKPSPENVKMLNQAMRHIKSVSYKVSLRWLFYRLLQDGIYTTKGDYENKFKIIISRARHTFYNGWYPGILSDETREIIWRGIGAKSEEEAINDISCNLDKFQNQDYFIMLLFEANAMTSQFEKYTGDIPLVAFGGDPSIPYKWELSMGIRKAIERYNKPVVLLYFGDCDEHGRGIYETAIKHIRNWSKSDFEVVYCGLTLKQGKTFNLPENPDKPGQYQWEALTDNQAREIIMSNILKYQNQEKIEKIQKLENDTLDKWKSKLISS